VVNLTAHLQPADPHAAVETGRRGADLARRLGLRHTQAIMAGNSAEAAIPTGDFGWTLDALDELLGVQLSPASRIAVVGEAILVNSVLGRPTDALLDELTASVASGEAGQAVSLDLARLWLDASRGAYRTAFDVARTVADASLSNAPMSFALAARLAVLDRDPARATEALDRLRALHIRGPAIDAQAQVAQAGIDALEGRTAEAAAAFAAVTRWLADQDLHFDEAIAWMCVVATTSDGDPYPASAEHHARTLLEGIPSPPYLALLDGLVARRAERATRRPTDVPAATSIPAPSDA
jgi:hypothetical protein